MCRLWTWPCLRAAFKLPAAKRPSCPAPSPPVLPSTISTSSGWLSRCPTPTNQSRYCKKHNSHIKTMTPMNPDLRFMQNSVYFQVFFSVACGTAASDGPFRCLCHTAQSRADSASDFALSHTALPPLVVWFHLSWLTCSCRPHKLTCLPSLWTLHWSAVQIIQSASALITLCPQQAQYHSCSHYTHMHAHV